METPVRSPELPQSLLEIDDPSSGPGGLRRPGKIWTAEAREDMFRRREAGETWETICLDYPNRSRHAMQQQFSMMKKQRALADGTWTENKRGRKRKHPHNVKKAVVKKRQPWFDDDDEPDLAEDDEETEDDFYGDAEIDEDPGTSEEVETNHQVTETEASSTQTRPPLPLRSATEPMSRPPRAKSGALSTPLTVSGHEHVASDVPMTNIDLEWNELETVSSFSKKRKMMPESPERMALVTPPSAGPQENLGIAFDEARLREIITEGRTRAHDAARAAQAERASLRQTFDASVSRANRRAHDADEKLRLAFYEHAEAMKAKDKKHAEEIQQLRHFFYSEQTERAKSHSREVEALKETINNQINEREDLEAANNVLREVLEAASKSSMGPHVERGDAEETDEQGMVDMEELTHRKKVDSDEKVDPHKNLNPEKELDGESVESIRTALVKTQEELSTLRDQVAKSRLQSSTADPKLRSTEVVRLLALLGISVGSSSQPGFAEEDLTADFTRLFNSLSETIKDFNRGLDDMSMKAIVKVASDIQSEMESARTKLDNLRLAVGRLNRNIHALVDPGVNSRPGEAHDPSTNGNGDGSSRELLHPEPRVNGHP